MSRPTPDSHSSAIGNLEHRSIGESSRQSDTVKAAAERAKDAMIEDDDGSSDLTSLSGSEKSIKAEGNNNNSRDVKRPIKARSPETVAIPPITARNSQTVWRMLPQPQQQRHNHPQQGAHVDWHSRYNILELNYAILQRDHQSLLQRHQNLITQHTALDASHALREEALRVRDRDQKACAEVLQLERVRRERDRKVFEREVKEARMRVGAVEEAYRELGILFQKRLGEVEDLKVALTDAEKEVERLRSSSDVGKQRERPSDEEPAPIDHSGLDIDQVDLSIQQETDLLEMETAEMQEPLDGRTLETEGLAQEDTVGQFPEIEEIRDMPRQISANGSDLEDDPSDEEPLMNLVAKNGHSARNSIGDPHAASLDEVFDGGSTCAQVVGEVAGVNSALITGTTNLSLPAGQDAASSKQTRAGNQPSRDSADTTEAGNSRKVIVPSDSATVTTSSANNVSPTIFLGRRR